jgi:hypothetical protein
MLNKLFIALSLILLGAACSKIKSTEKKMDGEWTIYTMKVTKSNGLSYYYETTGTFNFSEINDHAGKYALNMTYITPTGTVSKNESGKFILKEKGKYFDLYRDNPDGSITTIPDARIVLITKNDIEMLYQDNNEGFWFILEK